jgi:VWFA-related protein
MFLSSGWRGRAPAIVVVGLAVLLAAPAASVAQQAAQFRTTVEVVQLQVAVADARGDHPPNLDREDFLLRVNGRVRDITALYEVDLRQLQPDAEDDRFIPAGGWRQFLMFFDFSFTTRQGVLRAQEAAQEFVQRHTHPKDLIGVATYSTVGGLTLVSPFTSDRGQVLDAIGAFGLNRAGTIVDPAGFVLNPLQENYGMALAGNASSGVDPGSQRGQLNTLIEQTLLTNYLDAERGDFRRYREEAINYVDQLRELGTLLTATRGRKHVLLFSAGFSDQVLTGQTLDELGADADLLQAGQSYNINSESRFGSMDLRESLEEAMLNLQESDTVFHAFDVGGLGNEATDDTFRTTQSGKQALTFIADGTNGTVAWNSNDLTPFLADLAETTSRYYVLAYRKDAADPNVVELDVSVRRPGVRVTAAPRRFSPPPAYANMDDFQRQLQLAEYISKGIEEENMNFDVRAIPFAGDRRVNRVAVVVEVPFAQLEELAVIRGEPTAELDLLGYVLDENGQMRDLFSRRVKLDMDRMGAGRMKGLPFRYYDLLWSPAGAQKVRILLRDSEAGLLSTRTVDVEVPSFMSDRSLFLTGPVPLDWEHPGLIMRGINAESPPEHRQGGPVGYPFVVGDQELTPEVYSLTGRGGVCHFMIVAHNLSRHPFTGEVQTTIGAVAIDQFGSEHEVPGVRLLGSSYDPLTDATTMIVEATLPEILGEGGYLLEIGVSDTISGSTVKETMPFLITADADTDD